MRVEIAYERRVEVFDTDRFTEAQPFSGRSMLADFTYGPLLRRERRLPNRRRGCSRGTAREGLEVPAGKPQRGR